MKKMILCLFAAIVCFSVNANAETILLKGTILKKDNAYAIKTDKGEYLLYVDPKNKSKKEIVAAEKAKSSIAVIVEPQNDNARQKRIKTPYASSRLPIMKVDFTVKPQNIGETTGTFASLECGDSCYFTFLDDNGKEKTYYTSNFEGYAKFESDPTYKGKKVKIIWMKTGKEGDEIRRGVLAVNVID